MPFANWLSLDFTPASATVPRAETALTAAIVSVWIRLRTSNLSQQHAEPRESNYARARRRGLCLVRRSSATGMLLVEPVGPSRNRADPRKFAYGTSLKAGQSIRSEPPVVQIPLQRGKSDGQGMRQVPTEVEDARLSFNLYPSCSERQTPYEDFANPLDQNFRSVPIGCCHEWILRHPQWAIDSSFQEFSAPLRKRRTGEPACSAQTTTAPPPSASVILRLRDASARARGRLAASRPLPSRCGGCVARPPGTARARWCAICSR